MSRAPHHFHKLGGAGAQCVSCHMPATKYMVIDPRHDHSLRVPRPDLSVSLGVPNACNQCHRDKPAQWAADQMLKWYGRPSEGFQHYAFALDNPETIKLLAPLLEDRRQPDIARATATAVIARMPDRASVEAARGALADTSALVRHAFTEAQNASFKRAADEYVAAQRLHADRAEHRANLGTFYAQRGRFDEADAELRAALDLLPAYVPAWVNLADLRRIQGQDAAAEAALRDGLKAVPGGAPLHHALGLTLVRLKRTDEAVRELARAAHLAPEEPRFAYVHAVALHSTGESREALKVLEQALVRHPGDREMLVAAATFSRDLGDSAAALQYAERLAAQSPHD